MKKVYYYLNYLNLYIYIYIYINLKLLNLYIYILVYNNNFISLFLIITNLFTLNKKIFLRKIKCIKIFYL